MEKEVKCNFCKAIGDESTFKYDTMWMYWLCPVCYAKSKAAAEAPKKKTVVEQPVKVDDQVEEELDEQYQEQLRQARERKIAEKIERCAARKSAYYPEMKKRNFKKEPVSRIEGELYCQVCGGKKISKAGIMQTLDDGPIQKYKCSTCGYTFTRYHEEVKIV